MAITVDRKPNEVGGGLLSETALNFLEHLHRKFNRRRLELLSEREKRQKHLDNGECLNFLSSTQGIRNRKWSVAEAPQDLNDRRVEITGPLDRKMVINALNSGASVFMADCEDAQCPRWDLMLEGHANLCKAVHRDIDFTNDQGKEYKLKEKTMARASNTPAFSSEDSLSTLSLSKNWCIQCFIRKIPRSSSLEARDKRIFEYIKEYYKLHDSVPSSRQIGAALGYKSSRSAHMSIESLKKEGVLLERKPQRQAYSLYEENPTKIPLLGSIACGAPQLSYAEEESTVIDLAHYFGQTQNIFGLQVTGESMTGDAIHHGDLAMIDKEQTTLNSREIFALRVGTDEYSLKRIKKNGDKIQLIASNPAYETQTFPLAEISVIGKYVGLVRKS
jgi:SOS regulatory protein LexA